jgi:type I restriction enzyme R subunit
MNGFSEDKLRLRFEADKYKILIVASKYQTGFDQPLLKAMYVDRKLTGVTAVQTLSRLNRTYPGKKDVIVLDFENEPEYMGKQFQPFYDRIKLSQEVEPSKLYDIRSDLEDYGIHTPADVDAFCEVFYNNSNSTSKIAKLHALTAPVVELYRQMDEDDRKNYKSQMRDYVKLYSFLSQLVSFTDTRLEKLFAFSGFVVKKLPSDGKPLPVEVLNMTDLDNYKPREIGTKKIELKRGESEVKPKNYGATCVTNEEEKLPLSKIIEDLNEQFGTKFSEEDKVVISQLEQKLIADPQLEQQVASSSKQAARMSFEEVANDLLHGLIDSNFRFYKKVQNDKEISRELFDRLFERFYEARRSTKK